MNISSFGHYNYSTLTFGEAERRAREAREAREKQAATSRQERYTQGDELPDWFHRTPNP